MSAVLCLPVVPAWLEVTGAPHMLAEDDGGGPPLPAKATAGSVWAAGVLAARNCGIRFRPQSNAKEQG